MDIREVLAQVSFRDDKMAKVNLYETKKFFCDLYCLRPGQQQKVHSHVENDKLYYALRGEARVTVGEDTRPLKQGEIVLAEAGVPHGIANDGGEDVVCLVFMAPHPDVERLTG
jgi:quercetin dioxygenase-like cupin family protein